MSNAAVIYAPRAYDVRSDTSAAARRILRRAVRECVSGKKGYRTERKARVALTAIQLDEKGRQDVLGQDARVERNYYLCTSCSHYHLTSKE